ncbi:hypothetical protein CNMCM6106_002508 [Aspergillus hiratsukae]|uniref:Uncharacterized protein n=1 Tax=Aspergillus hiratsukae TaxID=1194566 RepID=A0A8H6UUU5_9EURO|nr:hypothetical protein CNMCM6106_002508 [Aspergillus hiratsukae]
MPLLLGPSVSALLISTGHCKAHWILAFNNGLVTKRIVSIERAEEDGEQNDEFQRIHAPPIDCEFPKVLDSIEFSLTDECPGLEEMASSLLFPLHLMKSRQCPCVQCVYSAILNYQQKRYITGPTDGTTCDKLMDRLVDLSATHRGMASRDN